MIEKEDINPKKMVKQASRRLESVTGIQVRTDNGDRRTVIITIVKDWGTCDEQSLAIAKDKTGSYNN